MMIIFKQLLAFRLWMMLVILCSSWPSYAETPFYKIRSSPGVKGITILNPVVIPEAQKSTPKSVAQNKDSEVTEGPDILVSKEYRVYIYSKSPKKVSQVDIDRTIRVMRRLPDKYLRQLKEANTGVVLLNGESVCDHERMARSKGKKGHHGQDMRYWNEVPAVSGSYDRPAIVVINRVKEQYQLPYSSPEEVIMHEVGHTFDSINGRLSSREEWMKVFDKSYWTNTYFMYSPSEAFAESFGQYYATRDTRSRIQQNLARDYFREMEW